MKIDIPIELSDDDLEVRLKAAARCEQEATGRFIAHLSEFDDRRLYRGAGFSSLFAYCCEILHLSEPAAYNRIEVARAARRFPAILPMLGEGLLSLATVRLLAPHLTVENEHDLLGHAAGKGRRGVLGSQAARSQAIAGLNWRADGSVCGEGARVADAADSGAAAHRQAARPGTL